MQSTVAVKGTHQKKDTPREAVDNLASRFTLTCKANTTHQ